MSTPWDLPPPLVQNADVTKDRQWHMRIAAEDEARLEALVKHHEMTAAQVVRMLIKREAESIAASERTKHAEAKPAPRASRRR